MLLTHAQVCKTVHVNEYNQLFLSSQKYYFANLVNLLNANVALI